MNDELNTENIDEWGGSEDNESEVINLGGNLVTGDGSGNKTRHTKHPLFPESTDIDNDLEQIEATVEEKVSGKGFKPGNQAWKNRENVGRPKKMQSLTTFIKRALEKGDTKKKLAEKIVQLAMDGNPQALKMLMERTEGLVSQKVEISGPNGEPLMPAVLILPSNGSEVMPSLPPVTIDAEFEEYDSKDEEEE